MPKGAYTVGVGVTGALLGRGTLDPDDPATARTYFERLFARLDTDAKQIQPLRAALDYPEVAQRFRMIDDDTQSIAVLYGTADEQLVVRRALDWLRTGTPRVRMLLRQLQPYLVSVRRREVQRFTSQGWISPVIEGLGEWAGAYDPVRGLMAVDPDPDAWVV